MTNPGFRPLYQQVRELLVQKVVSGDWGPGDALPSEFALGQELGVSQGTVRKALDALASEGILERRQGRGTFVTRHTPERSVFHFFRLRGEAGQLLTPQLVQENMIERMATDEEAAALDLQAGVSSVFSLERVRKTDTSSRLLETVVINAERVPNLHTHAPLPNAIYALYQEHYGISILEAREELRAVAAGPDEAERLHVNVGTPLLKVVRTAVDIELKPVELRTSLIAASEATYAVTLR